MRVSFRAASRLRSVALCLAALLVCLGVSACGAGIPYGSYHYAKLAIEIYEGLPITQGKGFTKAFVSCDPDEELIGGGFRSDDTNATPLQIVSSYPSDYAGNDVAAGGSPTTWTVEGYSATGGGRFSAYALCLESPGSTIVTVFTTTMPIAPNTSSPITALCPTGTVLLGGGFVIPHTAQNSTALPHLISLFPTDYTQWVVMMRLPATTHTTVLVESEAVCASGKISTALQQNQAPIGGNSSTRDAQVSCESGLALTGGGFANFPDSEQPPSFITSDYPLMNGATAVWDIGWQSPPASEVTMTIWAICGYSSS